MRRTALLLLLLPKGATSLQRAAAPPRRALRAVSAASTALVADGDAAKKLKKARPSRDDVERISWGKPSKKKGVGSRGVPHRLNADERDAFERAKRAGFVECGGSAWRAARRDAPLLNTWRNWCDAVAAPAICVQKSATGAGDVVLLDLSPLRRPGDFDACAAEARGLPGAAALAPTALGDGDADAPADDAADWLARPVHQLPRYEVAWTAATRGDAKAFAKELAGAFGHVAKKGAAPGAKRAPAVKAGKGRRHGGYGI